MDLRDSPEHEAFRAEVRAWLAAHRGEAPRVAERDTAVGDGADAALEQRRAWQRKLASAGLAGATWPPEYGGRGVGPIERVIISQEMRAAGVPGVLDVIGIGMVGPTIIACGSDEQKRRYLTPMLQGDEVWCQLFSEPSAGSDLAAIRTEASRTPDGGWRLAGQKVWTTNAHIAAFGLLLARTSPDVPKHRGLTMFIVPMDRPGIVVRGLRQISGAVEFNEVFLDDVAVGAEDVVGPVDEGWGVALTTLGFERLAIGGGAEGFGFDAARFAQAIAGDEAASRSDGVRQELGEIAAELEATRWMGYRAMSALHAGQTPGPEFALSKVTTTNGAIRAVDLVVDVLGLEGLAAGSEWEDLTSFLPGLKSGSGTEEILRTMIGERVLGLPPEPRQDKDVSFRELAARETQRAWT